MKYHNIILVFFISTIAYATEMNQTICDPNQGLVLLSQSPFNESMIKNIIFQCEKNSSKDVQLYLLKGLLARKEGLARHDFSTAIINLKQAVAKAAPDNFIPLLELALTYEWASQIESAKKIYSQILLKNPNQRAALLGSARVAAATNDISRANQIYQKLLQKNPNDVDVLNAFGRLELTTNYDEKAKEYFNKALQLSPNNSEAQNSLKQLNNNLIKKPQISCQVDKGLTLLNQNNPPYIEIKKILELCEKITPKNVQVLLLHGLLERKKGLKNNQFKPAIQWLKLAESNASINNDIPALELATTYYWASELSLSKSIYLKILAKNPTSRPALLGIANIAIAEKKLSQAYNIYSRFLKEKPNDINALLGKARILLINKSYDLSKSTYLKVLTLDPNNQDAKTGLEQIKQAIKAKPVSAVSPCDANKGLQSLENKNPPFNTIKKIITKCDRYAPNDVQTLLLKGLATRKVELPTKSFTRTIYWLQRASTAALPENNTPALELALTYEWALQPEKALPIYQGILNTNPNNYPALLGTARVALQQYRIKDADRIYQSLLQTHPKDVEALSGIARVKFTNKEFKLSAAYFNEALKLSPHNEEILTGLKQLDSTTRYILSLNQGEYTVSGQHSYSENISFFFDVNATDQFIMLLTHNSREIQLALQINPTILPKNSAFLGYQHQYPNKYGWGINYEYRERNQVPVENRIGINGNFYLMPNLQWIAGARDGFPSPWKDQLYYLGFTLYTKYPFNFSTTAYQGHDEIGGISRAYSYDLSKEFSDRSFYDLGASYSPTQHSWEVHGRFIWVLLKNQALEGLYTHYYFNNTNLASVGWRFYF